MVFGRKLLFLLFLTMFMLNMEAIKIQHKTNHDYKTLTDHGNGGISSSAVEFSTTKSNDIKLQTPNVQAKRDISLSYSATDIDSKEGSRVKTITVIKNLNKHGQNEEKHAINPELHKNEHWADAFRDHFDDFGAIPDVPDIDDLFEFMNKKNKPKQTTKEKEKEKTGNKTQGHRYGHKSTSTPVPTRKTNNIPKSQTRTIEISKPVVEPTVELATEASKPALATAQSPTSSATASTAENKNKIKSKMNAEHAASSTVEKIKGDAELISHSSGNGKRQNGKNADANMAQHSESLSLSRKRLHGELFNVNYSTPQHSVHQYFENYIQQAPAVVPNRGYEYPRPCGKLVTSSVSVSTPSGRTYDVPPASNANNVIINPYIAPSVAKKPLTQQQQQLQSQSQQPKNVVVNPNQPFPAYNTNQQQAPPAYSVNSIVPPLQSTSGNFGASDTTILSNNVQPSFNNQQQTPQTAVNNAVTPGVNRVGFSTSQRPYVAPNLRNGLGLSRVPPPTPIYNAPTGTPNYRINSNGVGGINKPIFGRSRGLKY